MAVSRLFRYQLSGSQRLLEAFEGPLGGFEGFQEAIKLPRGLEGLLGAFKGS